MAREKGIRSERQDRQEKREREGEEKESVPLHKWT